MEKSTSMGLLAAAGGLLASVGMPLPAMCGVAAAAGGAGVLAGRNEQRLENHEPGASPGLINRDALLGGLIGLVAVRLLSYGVISGLGVAAASAMPIVATAMTAAVVVGFYLGGRYGKKCAETEFETQMREGMSKLLGNGLSAQPHIMQNLIEQGKEHLTPAERNFTDEILRQQMQKQQQPTPEAGFGR